MTNLLQFTISVRKSHRQSQRTSQLVCEDRVLFVSSIQNASDQFVSFVNFALHPTLKTKIQRIQTPDSNSSISVTIRTNVLLTITDTITLKNIELSS